MKIMVLVLLSCLPAFRIGAAEFCVVLDAGHSPARPGAISARGVAEVVFNDRLAGEVSKRLEAGGAVRVVLSRKPQENLGLKKRSRRILAARPDLVVSIHHDSAQERFFSEWEYEGKKRRYSDKFSGFSLFVPTRGYYSEMSLMAAGSLADRLLEGHYEFSVHHAMKIPGESREWVDSGRGIYAADFLYLARNLRAPFVLLEAGVIVNRGEEARLSDKREIDRLAAAIADGILAFLSCVKKDTHDREPPGPRAGDVGVRHPRGIPSSLPIRWERAGLAMDDGPMDGAMDGVMT